MSFIRLGFLIGRCHLVFAHEFVLRLPARHVFVCADFDHVWVMVDVHWGALVQCGARARGKRCSWQRGCDKVYVI